MSAPASPRIEVRGAAKVFYGAGPPVEALRGVDFSVAGGEFLSIVGPSGCGKTTLIRLLAGLLPASAGKVRVAAAAAAPAPPAAVVFQEHALFPWRTALENAAFGLEMQGAPRADRRRAAGEYLRRLGLARFAGHYPRQLSGGMRQRVGLVRAFVSGAPVLLMDEPFGALDAQTRVLMQEELLRIWGEERRTVVYVTHAIDEAVYLGDRVLLLGARPGRVKGEYPVGLPRPRSRRTRADPAFAALCARIWEDLAGEVDLPGEGRA